VPNIGTNSEVTEAISLYAAFPIHADVNPKKPVRIEMGADGITTFNNRGSVGDVDKYYPDRAA